MAARHRAVAVDFGTGDGAYARRLAAADPGLLVIGIDANADNLRRASRRAAPNLLLGRMALERAPGELRGLADRLTVLLPWGSLLHAVAHGQGGGLQRLRAVCAPLATIDVVIGDGDDGPRSPEGLPERYREAGFEVSAERVPAAAVAALGTTWAKRLTHSDGDRVFWRLRGVALPALRPGSAPRTAS